MSSLLQLQAPDGSIVTIEPGSVFTLTGEGDTISFELVSGAMRVASSGTPIAISKGGVTISTTGGAFSAFESEEGGLSGRVNQGSATVANGAGSRDFATGQGYEANETSIAGTFTPPPVNTTQLTQPEPDDTNYSPADDQGSEGSEIVEEAAGGGSGGYGGTPPVTGVVVPVTGDEDTGYVIAYAADSVGIDARDDVTVTIGSGGELNQYQVGDGSDERLERNSNASLERADSNGNVFIERWAGGETHGNYYNDYNGTTFSSLGRTSHQGFHSVYGKPTAEGDIPTAGVATYDLVAATNPTIDDGSFAPGTFTGELGVLFGPIFKVGVDFTVDMPGDHTYAVLTAGGAAAPSAAPQYKDFSKGLFRINDIAVAQGGATCPSANCTASLYGLFTGAAGEDLGVAYQIMDFSVPTDDLFRGKRISGAAVFTQGSYTPGDPPPSSSSGEIEAPLGAGPYLVAFDGVFVDTSTVELDGDGALSSFVNDYTGEGGTDRGDASVAELWGNEDVTIGRWNDGTTTGYLAKQLDPLVDGYHYAVGTAALNLPAYGVASYTLAAATAPTFADGGGLPGTLSGAMSIGYGGGMPSVGLDLEIDMPDDHVYVVETPGGLALPHLSPFVVYTTGSVYPTNSIVMAGSGTFTIDSGGRACPSNGSCFFSLYGFVSGEGGSSAALNYKIWQSGYFAQSISGSGAFTTDGAEVASLSDPLDTPFADGNYTALVTKPGSNATYRDKAAVFGPNGELISYQVRTNPGSESTPNIGSNGMAELGRTDDAMWGRWTGGETGGTGTFNGYVGADLSGDRGMHWMVGNPASDLPTSGTAEYELAGYSAPVFNDGRAAPGTLTGAMTVAWGGAGATKIGTDLDVAMAGDAVYHLVTTGGAANPSTSEFTMGVDGSFGGSLPVTFTGDGAGTGSACPNPGSCNASMSGQAFGQGGKTIGIGYVIGFGDSGITGNGVFTQAAPPPP
jgi:trimeric autotransporter adhesin